MFDGLTGKQWKKIFAKCAAWLEKNDLYIGRGAITDKTPNLPCCNDL